MTKESKLVIMTKENNLTYWNDTRKSHCNYLKIYQKEI